MPGILGGSRGTTTTTEATTTPSNPRDRVRIRYRVTTHSATNILRAWEFHMPDRLGVDFWFNGPMVAGYYPLLVDELARWLGEARAREVAEQIIERMGRMDCADNHQAICPAFLRKSPCGEHVPERYPVRMDD